MFEKDQIKEMVCVLEIKPNDKFMPSAATSRSGFSLAMMSPSYVGIFEREDGSILQMNVPEKYAGSLQKGMRGTLIYNKKNKFVDFEVL